MSELLLRRNERIKRVNMNDLAIVGIGGVLGLVAFAQTYFLIAPIFCFFMIRSRKESSIFALSLMTVTAMMSFTNLLESVAILFVIFLWFQWCKLFKIVTANTLMVSLPILTGVIAWTLKVPWPTLAILMFVQFAFANEIYQHFNWLKKDLKLPESIYGMIIFALGIFSIESFPLQPLIFAVILFILLLFIAKIKTTMLLYLIFSLLYIGVLPLEIFGCLLLLYILSKQALLMNLFMFVAITQLPYTWTNALLWLCVFVLFNLLRVSEIPFETSEDSRDYAQFNKIAVMNRQLNNFSVIFDSLADYYAEISEMEAEVLKTMSRALSYTAKNCTHHSIDCDMRRNQVLDLLDGYKIEVEDCQLIEDDHGCMTLDLELKDFQKHEVESTLLPLLNHLLPTKMEMQEKKLGRSYSGIYHYSFVSCAPIQIDAYADSITHEMSACGDTFSIFRYASNVLCMISDGMGSGLSASKISTSITAIFQRMIASDIPQIEAIRCINKLIQSDQYATMDVLSFDRYRKSVTVCKSAACPTFLIRQNELYEINGNSLPVGIVASIEVDSVSVEVEKDDWFLMASDGVYIDEIYRWIHTKKNKSAKDEVGVMMEILKEKKRQDDSTFLLAHVI